MDDRRARLEKVVERRDRLREEVQRVVGKLEAARQELSLVEEECRAKGLDPEKLDEAITKLGQRLDLTVVDLETRVANSEKALRAFVEEG